MKIGVKRLHDHREREWAIWCNESKGSWIEHYHDADGHVFPVMDADLRALRKRLNDLAEKGEI